MKIYSIVTALAIGLFLTSCGNGNRDNQMTDTSMIDTTSMMDTTTMDTTMMTDTTTVDTTMMRNPQ